CIACQLEGDESLLRLHDRSCNGEKVQQARERSYSCPISGCSQPAEPSPQPEPREQPVEGAGGLGWFQSNLASTARPCGSKCTLAYPSGPNQSPAPGVSQQLLRTAYLEGLPSRPSTCWTVIPGRILRTLASVTPGRQSSRSVNRKAPATRTM